MTITLKPTASETVIEQNGSDICTIDSTGLAMASGMTITGAGVGKILQVVQMVKTDTSSATSASTNTFVDLPGMSVAITPSSSSSKILVSFTVSLGFVVGTFHINLVRGSTNIAVGDADGSRVPSTISTRPAGTPYTHDSSPRSYTFLDSPNTTSATTYKLQGTLGSTYSGTMYVNRSAADTNASYGVRVTSTMTAMEVAG
tara:strand:- start:539 stop:1141 length:603 start_codon:yes stop_codon:yes gene_type:complete